MWNHLANCDWACEYTELAKERTVEEMWALMKSKLPYLRNQFIRRQTISGKPSWKDKGIYPIRQGFYSCHRAFVTTGNLLNDYD